MRAAVIGAGGFIGDALVRRIAATGADVFALDIAAAAELPAQASFTALDVTAGPFELPDNVDAVFYLAQSAAYRDFPQSAGDLFAVNVMGAVHAAVAARQAGARFFLYASTGNVYAPSFAALSETSELTNNDPYAVSKLTAERALSLFRTELTVLTVRLFGVFGPNQKSMLPVLIRQRVESGEPIRLEPSPINPDDDGGLRVSFTYVEDVVTILFRLAEQALAGTTLPEVLNVANPRAKSIREFAGAVGEILGKAPVFQVGETARCGDLVADITTLQDTLGCEFTPFERAIGRTLE